MFKSQVHYHSSSILLSTLSMHTHGVFTLSCLNRHHRRFKSVEKFKDTRLKFSLTLKPKHTQSYQFFCIYLKQGPAYCQSSSILLSSLTQAHAHMELSFVYSGVNSVFSAVFSGVLQLFKVESFAEPSNPSFVTPSCILDDDDVSCGGFL